MTAEFAGEVARLILSERRALLKHAKQGKSCSSQSTHEAWGKPFSFLLTADGNGAVICELTLPPEHREFLPYVIAALDSRFLDRVNRFAV